MIRLTDAMLSEMAHALELRAHSVVNGFNSTDPDEWTAAERRERRNVLKALRWAYEKLEARGSDISGVREEVLSA